LLLITTPGPRTGTGGFPMAYLQQFDGLLALALAQNQEHVIGE
jgi:hypothetical protein